MNLPNQGKVRSNTRNIMGNARAAKRDRFHDRKWGYNPMLDTVKPRVPEALYVTTSRLTGRIESAYLL
jgi:hypothetical protein